MLSPLEADLLWEVFHVRPQMARGLLSHNGEQPAGWHASNVSSRKTHRGPCLGSSEELRRGARSSGCWAARTVLVPVQEEAEVSLWREDWQCCFLPAEPPRGP